MVFRGKFILYVTLYIPVEVT